MTDTCVIACRTVQQELDSAMARCGCHLPVVWLESGLHNIPSQLHNALQAAIDACADCQRVLLAMGFCGNAVVGIHSDTCQVVLPRTDDCIGLFLGNQRHSPTLNESFFFTEGWLKGERTIWWEYQRAARRYGEERAKRIFDVMLHNYKRILLVDTGCYDPEPVRQEIAKMAEVFSLGTGEIPGNLNLLTQLLTGPWDNNHFVILPPGQTLKESHVYL